MVYTAWCTIMVFSVAPLCLLLLPVLCFGFDYEGDHGPSNWGNEYPMCKGKRQSPINIDRRNVKNVRHLTPLNCSFNDVTLITATNNGHSVQLESHKSEEAMVSGGPLKKDTYTLAQCHFHWGRNDSEGSEHLFNGRAFPLELHCVFYNKKYGSITEALNHEDGLVVLTNIYDVCSTSNPIYDPVVEAISEIRKKGTTKELKRPVPLRKLFPDPANRECYYSYKGSLTTPGCNEVATFIIFKKHQCVSHEQMDAFRTGIWDSKDNPLTHNFRPPQPLNDRVVLHNIPKRPCKLDEHSGQSGIELPLWIFPLLPSAVSQSLE